MQTMQKGMEYPEHVGEFVDKYEKTNPITRYLINNFYNNLEVLIPKDAKKILEPGCGAGYSAERIISMTQSGTHFEGSDIGEDLLTLARERNPGITFINESIYELEREDNSFDCVLALETLEHLEDPLKALKELKRVSSKYVIVSVPREPIWRVLNCARGTYLKEFGNTPGHINHWSKRGIVKFVSQELTVIDTRTPLPWTMVLAKVEK